MKSKTSIGQFLEKLATMQPSESLEAMRQEALNLEAINRERDSKNDALKLDIQRKEEALEELETTWNRKKQLLQAQYKGEEKSLEEVIAARKRELQTLDEATMATRTRWVIDSQFTDMQGLRLITVHTNGLLSREREKSLQRHMLPEIIDHLKGVDLTMNIVVSYVAEEFQSKVLRGHLFLHMSKGTKGRSVQLTRAMGIAVRVSDKDKFNWQKNSELMGIVERLPAAIEASMADRPVAPYVAQDQPLSWTQPVVHHYEELPFYKE